MDHSHAFHTHMVVRIESVDDGLDGFDRIVQSVLRTELTFHRL